MTIEKPHTVEDDIRAAMAELKGSPEPAPESAPVAADDGEADPAVSDEQKEPKARERDPATGKFKSADKANKPEGEPEAPEADKAKDAALDKPEGEGQPAEQPAAGKVDIPQHWSVQDKAAFAKLPPESQSWVMGRIKAMEADHTRKTQEAAEIRREAQPVLEVFAPYREKLALAGVTPGQVVQRWAAAEQFLQRDPKAALKWIAGNYGVDLGDLTKEAAEAPQVDPTVAELRKELASLRENINGFTTGQAKAAEAAQLRTIEEFALSADAGGQLLHPHFDEVMDDMLRLARIEREAGRTPDLEALYESACWASPTVRNRLLEAQRSAAAQEIERQAKEKAAKAKAAGSSVRDGAAGPPDPVPVLGLREELTQRMRGSI